MTLVTTEGVAAEIRALLARRNIRAAELAALVGVTPMWLSRRLRGTTPLTVDDLGRLCDALDVDVAEVLGVAPLDPADLSPAAP